MRLDRQRLITAISSPNNAWRLLYLRGETQRADATTLAPARTAQFLGSLSRKNLDATLLAQLHFLAGASLEQFVDIALPELLRAGHHIGTGVDEQTKGGIRGRINWSRTCRGRAAARLHQGAYIVRRNRSSWDTPLNQLLKLLLTNLSTSIASVASEVGSGSLPRHFLGIKAALDLGLRQSWMREVTAKRVSSALMRHASHRARNRHYGTASDLLATYESVAREGRWESIAGLIRAGWFEPIPDDDLFELFVLMKVLSTLRDRLNFGEPYELGLIRSGRREVARFRRADGVRADVYFDQSPAEVFGFDRSLYKAILASYENLSGRMRRPDITVKFSVPNREKRLLIECKRTDDDGYRRDSVYKVLGYLKDFSELWSGSHQSLKAVVVFPESIRLKDASIETGELGLVAGDDDARLAELLSRASEVRD